MKKNIFIFKLFKNVFNKQKTNKSKTILKQRVE